MSLRIRNTIFGEGKPLMAVSLTGETRDEIAGQAAEAVRQQADVIEWRADYFLAASGDLANKLLEPDIYAQMLRIMDDVEVICKGRPRIFTIRTKGQGGMVEMTNDMIYGVQEFMAQSGLPDFIDVEVKGFKPEYGGIGGRLLQERIDMIHDERVKVLLSYHDPEEMILASDIVKLVAAMTKYGADMYKVAAMAHTRSEANGLLQATEYLRKRVTAPMVTMAMGEAGKITRIAGGRFGSCMSFAALGEGSAPGQLPADVMRKKLDEVYG